MLGTLKHLDCDMSRVSHQVVRGKHCQYVRELDEKGESIFGQLALAFLSAL